MVSDFSKQVTKSSLLHFSFYAGIMFFLVLFSSCKKDNATAENTGSTLACKKRPGQITFGRDVSDIKYNAQDKPIIITTTQYSDPSAPSQPPVTTVYTITYNGNGKADKVTKSVNNQTELYYQMDYSPNGQLIKLSRSNAQGALIASTVAQYDNSNMLAKITTYIEGGSGDVTSVYHYANGNLIKKSVDHLYDLDSKEFYSAEYTYTYFPDKENKITSYFEGPLGLLFISNLSNKQALQYLPDRADYQLFFTQETPSEKKMLKNIEIIAHRYNTSDTSNIDYSYEYDTDGFPTLQKGTYKNVTRRNVPSQFGAPELLVTPHNNSFEKTMSFNCN